jgi:hypothetical protein
MKTSELFCLSNIDKKYYYLSGVYKLYHLSDLNKVYIGSTCGNKKYGGFYNRMFSHISRLLKNKHHSYSLQNIINKYGINDLRLEIVEVEKINNIILEKEQYWIDYYISYNINYGYNTLKKVTKRTHPNNSNKVKILQYSLKGDFIKEWESIQEAANFYNGTGSNISQAAKSITNKQVHGFQWKYYINDDYSLKIEEYHQTNTTKVYQYDLDGNFVKEYDSINKAANEINVHSSEIFHSINRKSKRVKEWMFSKIKYNKIESYKNQKSNHKKETIVLDILENKELIFLSLKEACNELGEGLRKVKTKNKLHKKRYTIINKKK